MQSSRSAGCWIAPSTYYRHAIREADPHAGAERWRRDRALEVEARRVWNENRQVYGVRKAWCTWPS